MIEYKAPQNYSLSKSQTSIFLAGSIEMGKADNWQEQIAKDLKDYNVTLLNPRRTDWNTDWKQTIKDKNFREQVQWELQALDDCDLIVMYLDPNTKSPISLLEFGRYADSGKLLVCCPDGFYRKGNIEVVCDKYKIPLVATYEMLVEIIKLKL